MSLILDAHTHIGLKSFIVQQISVEKMSKPAFRDRLENHDYELLERLSANQVAQAVAFPYPIAEVDAALANRYVLDAAHRAPDRIIPFALIGDDVEDWLAAGARGFKQHDILQEPQHFDLRRAYRVIAGAGVPLIVHLRSGGGYLVSQGVHEILSLAPELKVIVAHMGRSQPNTAQGVEQNLFSLQNQANVFFESSTVRDPEAIRMAVQILGEDRVLYGSDFPFNSVLDPDPMATELAMIEQANLSPRAQKKVLGENLLACLEPTLAA